MSLQPGRENLSTEDLIARSTTGSSSSATRAGQLTCSAKLPVHRPALYRIRGPVALDGQVRRGLPGHHHGLLELDGGRRRPVDLAAGGAFNCGKAQPGQIRSGKPWMSVGTFRGVNILNTVEERPLMIPPRRRRPSADRRRQAGRADETDVIVTDRAEAPLRWAGT